MHHSSTEKSHSSAIPWLREAESIKPLAGLGRVRATHGSAGWPPSPPDRSKPVICALTPSLILTHLASTCVSEPFDQKHKDQPRVASTTKPMGAVAKQMAQFLSLEVRTCRAAAADNNHLASDRVERFSKLTP